MRKIKQLTAGVASVLSAVVVTPAFAGVSANVGLVSEYYFRGLNLGDAGVYAGADFEAGGFYAGTWWIDDGSSGNDGLETDFYLGYNLEINESFSLGIGYNRYEYTYTSDFEHEVSLTGSFGPISLEYTSGKDDDNGGDETDYDFYAISWGGEVFGATIGSFENDDTNFSYDYLELSASGEIQGLSVSVHLGKTTNVEAADGAEEGDFGFRDRSGDGYMFLDISKSFDLM